MDPNKKSGDKDKKEQRKSKSNVKRHASRSESLQPPESKHLGLPKTASGNIVAQSSNSGLSVVAKSGQLVETPSKAIVVDVRPQSAPAASGVVEVEETKKEISEKPARVSFEKPEIPPTPTKAEQKKKSQIQTSVDKSKKSLKVKPSSGIGIDRGTIEQAIGPLPVKPVKVPKPSQTPRFSTEPPNEIFENIAKSKSLPETAKIKPSGAPIIVDLRQLREDELKDQAKAVEDAKEAKAKEKADRKAEQAAAKAAAKAAAAAQAAANKKPTAGKWASSDGEEEAKEEKAQPISKPAKVTQKVEDQTKSGTKSSAPKSSTKSTKSPSRRRSADGPSEMGKVPHWADAFRLSPLGRVSSEELWTTDQEEKPQIEEQPVEEKIEFNKPLPKEENIRRPRSGAHGLKAFEELERAKKIYNEVVEEARKRDVTNRLPEFGIPVSLETNLDKLQSSLSPKFSDVRPFTFYDQLRYYYSPVLRTYCLVNSFEHYKIAEQHEKSFKAIDCKRLKSKEMLAPPSSVEPDVFCKANYDEMKEVSFDADHFKYLCSLAEIQTVTTPFSIIRDILDELVPSLLISYKYYGTCAHEENYGVVKRLGESYTILKARLEFYNNVMLLEKPKETREEKKDNMVGKLLTELVGLIKTPSADKKLQVEFGQEADLVVDQSKDEIGNTGETTNSTEAQQAQRPRKTTSKPNSKKSAVTTSMKTE